MVYCIIFLFQAHIFCRSHGFTSAFEIKRGSDFGVMSMKFATNGFSCFGYETELLDCQYNGFTYCTEYDAAGVVCTSKYNMLKCGFCKKLLLYECNSDQLPTFFIFGWVQQQSNSKATANPPKSDNRMKKVVNWSDLHS